MKKNKKWTVLALICLLMLMVLPVKAETTGSIAIQLHFRCSRSRNDVV